MKSSSRRYLKFLFGFLVFCALVSLPWPGVEVPGLGMAQAKIIQGQVVPEEAEAPLDRTHPQIRTAMALQERHTAWLMALPDVVGTATGLSETGRPAILVFTRRPIAPGAVPSALDGLPVVVQVTGEFVSMATPQGRSSAAKTTVDPKSRFERPVPIGVSTGNWGECSAGTIGARVKDNSGNVYALSNNHVYALENKAAIGSNVLQPGRYDAGCAQNTNDVIGTLAAFKWIDFSGADNKVDAAIATAIDKLGNVTVGNATPSDGYGTPQTATQPEALNLQVQKYGRTTKLTKGTITGINATVNVGYSSGTARFVGQIIVSGKKPFIKAGDSGSLLVTDPGRNPVGLLFAGTVSGVAVANPIGDVLGSFDVTIDGDE